MLTRSKIKFIKSLQEKKYRKQEQCFIVEGAKSVEEVLQSGYEVLTLVATKEYASTLAPIESSIEVLLSQPTELASLGEFKTNETVLAIVKMKPPRPIQISTESFSIVLDDIRDPGNLGTIIRTADWYGINTIVASEETVDCFNSKVIASAKGSFTRVDVLYASLPEVLQSLKIPIYGAVLEGTDVHTVRFSKTGVLVIGNESNGISPSVEKYISDKVTIPRFGKAESLNAAIAMAIILDNIRR
jgi:RNA methyltransferase, TrmH family